MECWFEVSHPFLSLAQRSRTSLPLDKQVEASKACLWSYRMTVDCTFISTGRTGHARPYVYRGQSRSDRNITLDALGVISLLWSGLKICVQLKFNRHWCFSRHFLMAGKSRTLLILPFVHMLEVKCFVSTACVIFEVSVKFQSWEIICGGSWSGSEIDARCRWSIKPLLELSCTQWCVYPGYKYHHFCSTNLHPNALKIMQCVRE